MKLILYKVPDDIMSPVSPPITSDLEIKPEISHGSSEILRADGFSI